MASSTVPLTKICSKCGIEKPLTAEYFFLSKPKGDCPPTFNANCRECGRIAAKRYRTENPEKVAEGKRKYRARDPEKTRERDRQNYLKHKDRADRNSRDWKARNREKLLGYKRKSYLKNVAKERESRRVYAQQNPDICRAKKLRYRARAKALPATFTPADWQRTLDYFNGCCAVCGRQLNGMFHTAAADHWIPLSSPDCPGTVPTNIVPLCHGEGGCNNTKHTMLPIVWLERYFGKRKAQEAVQRIERYFEWVRDICELSV